MSEKTSSYHIPDGSPWPICGSIGLFTTVIGAANFIQQHTEFGRQTLKNTGHDGQYILPVGLAILFITLIMWWRDTIKESLAGMNSVRLDHSYRMGMMWFIFSEVMFFSAFFGALFYSRLISVPWLGGAGDQFMTHEVLWPNFQAMWPLVTTPDGHHLEAMSAWGLPAINTAILLTSSVTITIAHHALLENKRTRLAIFHLITMLLGVSFLTLQAHEYHEAYTQMGLTLHAGIYGTTFFMLTGFHGLHVTIGTIFLTVMWIRVLKGHATPDNHFAWEAAAWYWHFVDVVWLFLFVCVYWL